MKSDSTWEVAVDIGGTFTDVVALNLGTGRRFDGKVLTTPSDPVQGVQSALAKVVDGGVDLTCCSYFVHATTLGSNTLIERRGARMGMLTTRGLRDVTEIGREARYDLYDLQIELHQPLVDRDLRVAVDERINARGTVVRPLSKTSVEAAITQLGDVEAVVVCFLHSYANDAHEREAARLVQAAMPTAYVCASAEVAPIMREYERFVLATVNGYIAPRMSEYLGQLRTALDDRGFVGTIGIMKSDGGMCTLEEAAGHPVRILESGPAAGIVGAARSAAICREDLAVAFDMGGTTAKACLVIDGQPAATSELEVARRERFVAGSGFPLRVTSLDVIEIGAGGGSIAWLDRLGILQVGPASASADPGPACYGRGGQEPTVTDADLLLGYLDRRYFAGGTMEVDPDRSAEAIDRAILGPAGFADVTVAAWAIHDIVNENMARAARRHCLEHGVDPRSVALIATGGAGPVHAAYVAMKLGARKVIYPPSAGVASAWGLLLAPRSAEAMVTAVTPIDSLDDGQLQARLDEIGAELRERYDGDFTATAQVEMRVTGQGYEIPVDVSEGRTVKALEQAFITEYAARFGRTPWSSQREIVRWIVRLTEPRHRADFGAAESGPVSPATGERRAYFGQRVGWRETPVIRRGDLEPMQQRLSPLIISEADTTIVIPPGHNVWRDEADNVHVEPFTERSDGIDASTLEMSAAGTEDRR
jgi:N-methylhydantoinase A